MEKTIEITVKDIIAAAYQMGLAEGRKEQKPAEWKPNEEQIEALDDAIAMFGYMRMADTLRELYADLKKL